MDKHVSSPTSSYTSSSIQTRSLLTGVSGFVGSHLAEYLLSQGEEVHGIKRWRSPLKNISHILPKITLHEADLLEKDSLTKVIKEVKPDFIYHLAAQSYVPYSFTAPDLTMAVNAGGTQNLYEAIIQSKVKSIKRIHFVSSSEVYGQVSKQDVPIKETQAFNPQSPYGASKASADTISKMFFDVYGLPIIRTRAFTHSVSKWTPVILRDSISGLIDIKYISEIRQKQKTGGYLSGKMLDNDTQIWDMTRHNLEVWNDRCWTKIKHLSCHPIKNNKLLEISCRQGVVDATDNHSIINNKNEPIQASSLKNKDKIKITKLPKVEKTIIPEELAWLYGLFVAEGTVTNGKLKISNKNIDLLKKCKRIFLQYLAIDSTIDFYEKESIYTLRIRKPFEISKRFYKDCYASDKNKKIPQIVLNAKKEIKVAFLEGYNCGDGDNNNNVCSKFYRFKTKSPILALGLCCFIETVLNVKYKIHVEHRKDNRYFEIRALSQTNYSGSEHKKAKNKNHFLKPDNEIVKITQLKYSDEVWDFETENHWFHAGIGGNIVHNTGPRRGEVFVVSAFAKQIAEIEVGKKKEPTIEVGNLESIRTFMDVRDIVKIYYELIRKGKPGEAYNIGGNTTMTIGGMLNKLLLLSDISIIPVEKRNLLRKADVTLQIPDLTKLNKLITFDPSISFEKTLSDILEYWRKEVRK